MLPSRQVYDLSLVCVARQRSTAASATDEEEGSNDGRDAITGVSHGKLIDHATVFIASWYHVRNQLPFPVRRRLPVQSAVISNAARAAWGRSDR